VASKAKIGELFFDIRAGIAELQKDLTKGRKEIAAFTKNIDSTFKTLGNALTGYLSIKAISSFSNAISDLAKRGELVGSVVENFEALGGSSRSIEEARKATLGLVNSFDLMRIANTGLIRDIPQFNDSFGKMAELAARFADATG